MVDQSLILASTSKSRQSLLRNAGLEFDCLDSKLDEDAVKAAFLNSNADQDIADLAMILAQAKAMRVSEQHPDCLVIGADQTLICDNRLYSKPVSQDEAREQLLALSGKTHTLETAVACARAGEIVWSYREGPTLKMRPFSPAFLGRYMAAVGDDVMTTVGGYKLEARGIQLFEKIDGSYFAILGLPLLPLLEFLRQQGLVET